MRTDCGLGIHFFKEGPFCNCGRIRNKLYKRTWWQKLLGYPKHGGDYR